MTCLSSKMFFNEILNSEFGFRLDSSYILNYTVYNKIMSTLKQTGIDIAKLSEFVKIRRKGVSGRTATILIRSLWKASIHPLKIEVRTQGNRFLCKEHDIIGVATGLGSIGKFSIVPKYLSEITKQPLATTADLIILEPYPDKKRGAYYIVTLLNTRIGRVISNMLTYGSTGQLHLDAKWLEDIKIPIINNYEDIIRDMESAIENYEAKAWRAYFKSIKIVEEYLGADVEQLSGTSSYREVDIYGRLDAKFYVYINALRRLSKAQILKANELFDVRLGTAPRSREYKSLKRGEPYVSYDAIDDSGFIDEELFYRLPNPPRTTARARKFSILVTSVAHSIEGIGKVGILYPYDNMLCMTGLAILNPSSTKLRSVAQKIDYLKEKSVEEFMLYAFAVLKSRLMRRVMQSLTYGLTAQISKKDVENLPIPLIKDLLDSNVTSSVKEFIENMYQANILKRHAVMKLENYILRLLG